MQKFQEVITQLVEKYRVDLSQQGSCLQLASEGNHWLSVEVQDWDIVIVSCYYASSHNTFIADPGVTIWINDEEWRVLEIHQDMSGGPSNPSPMSGSARGGVAAIVSTEEMEQFLDAWAVAIENSNLLSLEELL
jgi:hypothetical protein